MRTVQEIRDLKAYLVDDLHGGRVSQQQTDQSFYEDSFTVPDVPHPFQIYRSGKAARMVDRAVEQIITSNPQVFRIVKKESEYEANQRVMALLNKWIKLCVFAIDECAKKSMVRGEAWLHPVLSGEWDKEEGRGMPVKFEVPDPLIVFADYTEEEYGIPSEVIIFCEKHIDPIQEIFPNWKPKDSRSKKVKWLEWWSKEARYFEADGIPVLPDEIQKNILKFVPFGHCYAGFGMSSPDGKPESLVISRLTRVRDRLLQQCTVDSDITSSIHQLTFPYLNLILPENTKAAGDIKEKYKMGPRAFNILYLPDGAKLQKGEILPPSAEVFQHSERIERYLTEDDPLVLGGVRTGESSGRQTDILGSWASKRYDKFVANIQGLFAIGLGMALRMVDTIPRTYPKDDLHKNDINGNYTCEVLLKSDNPLDRERLIAQGSRLFANKQISHKRFLIDHYGMTDEQADEEITDILIDQATIYNPMFSEMIGLEFAQERGLESRYDSIKKRRQQLEARLAGLGQTPTTPPAGGRSPEVETPTGQEAYDMALAQRGQRMPPTEYTRGEEI